MLLVHKERNQTKMIIILILRRRLILLITRWGVSVPTPKGPIKTLYAKVKKIKVKTTIKITIMSSLGIEIEIKVIG